MFSNGVKVGSSVRQAGRSNVEQGTSNGELRRVKGEGDLVRISYLVSRISLVEAGVGGTVFYNSDGIPAFAGTGGAG